MSQRERHGGRDLTFSQAHRLALPQHYGRIGHRLDVADRDWTEFCHHCKEPLAIFEEVRDVGQNVADKATTVTRRLARRASLPAWLIAWRVARPVEVQAEIDRLNRRVRDLEALYPIVGFKTRKLSPDLLRVKPVEPGDLWEWILSLHRLHHRSCRKALTQGELAVNEAALRVAMRNNPAWRADESQAAS